MKHETLLITFPSNSAFAVGFKQEGRSSQPLVKAPANSRQAAQNDNDYSAAQEVECVEEQQSQAAPLNPNLYPLMMAIRQLKHGGVLGKFA